MAESKSFTSSVHVDQALSGFGAGLISTAILHPLDVVKIRFQVDPAKQAWNSQVIGGTIHSFKDIAQKEGVLKGLYRGVATSVVGAAASWGLYFWCRIKKRKTKDKEGRLAAWQHLVASAEAGAITVITTNPIWVIKTRICSTTRYTSDAYNGFWSGLTRLVTEEGLRGAYRGMVPALFGVTHAAIQFMSYEELKKWRHDVQHSQGKIPKHERNANLSTQEYLTMASVSKVTAAVVTYPYQVVRSRLQVNNSGNGEGECRGAVNCVKKIKSVEGFGGFYKGMAPNIIRVLPGTCVTFLVYENLTQYFKKHATN